MTEFSLALNNSDFSIGKFGRIELSAPIKTVQDRIQTRLYTELGEWFLDVNVGVPWYPTKNRDGILGSKMQADNIGAIIRNQILTVDGVVRIEEFTLSQDMSTRTVTGAAQVVVLENGTEKLAGVTF